MRPRPLVLAVLASLAVGATASAGAAATGLPAWDVAPAASPSRPASLHGVAAVGRRAVWAVGSASQAPLAERWNGSAFVAVPVPGVAGRAAVLEGVDGVGGKDVWAVGHADRTDLVGSTSLVYRWNGDAWTRVPSPNAGTAETANDLLAVAALAHDDAWAVGQRRDVSSLRAITLHWDGTAWRSVSNGCGSGLAGVTALGPNDVWAVGGATICHWTGARWATERAPTVPGRTLALQDVDGVPGGLWAVGIEASSCGEGLCFGGVVLRRTATGWVREAEGYSLSAVTAVSASEAWAVGLWAYGPLLLHRDASGWRPAPTPDTPGIGRLFGVAVRRGSLWAVGEQLAGGSTDALALRAPSPFSGAVEGTTGVGHATVTWLGPESGTIEANQFGGYQAGGLTAGAYTFIAAAPGCAPASRSVTVRAGATLTLDLRPAC